MSALVRFNTKWDRDTTLTLYFQYLTGDTELTVLPPAGFSGWVGHSEIQVVEAGTQVESAVVATGTLTFNDDGSVIVKFPWTDTVDALFTEETAPNLKYDVLIADAADGDPFKLAAGTIILEDSVTEWPTA